MSNKTTTPKPVLKEGTIYSADNGQRICLHCAGASAKFTGRDRSGKKVKAFTAKDAAEWYAMLGKPLACECGRTTFSA